VTTLAVKVKSFLGEVDTIYNSLMEK